MVNDVVREHGVSNHTIYPWKTKHGGQEGTEVEQLHSWKVRTRAEVTAPVILT